MKANELRIGNLVNYGDSPLIVDINVLRDLDVYNKHKIKPIPLTEEWLVKLGFKHQYKLIKSEDFFVIEINSDSKLYINLNKMEFRIYKAYIGIAYSSKIHFVHQLQNLYFALTGEELTLNP
jgi:hypothetical protein